MKKNILLSDQALEEVMGLVIGDNSKSPYLTMKELIKLFKSLGIEVDSIPKDSDSYSRQDFALECLKMTNLAGKMLALFEKMIDSRRFNSNETTINLGKLVENIKCILEADGYLTKVVQGKFIMIGFGKTNTKIEYYNRLNKRITWFIKDLRQFVVEMEGSEYFGFHYIGKDLLRNGHPIDEEYSSIKEMILDDLELSQKCPYFLKNYPTLYSLLEKLDKEWPTNRFPQFTMRYEYIPNQCHHVLNKIKELRLSAEPVNFTMSQEYFSEIKKQILKKLDSAEYSVWIAMAWFTEKEFVLKLKDLKNKGIDIQILIYDDEINHQTIKDIKNLFQVFTVKKNSNSKMHNKFCIIDFKTIINGSYNWTKTAEVNNENIQITEDPLMAQSFAKEFVKIKMSKT